MPSGATAGGEAALAASVVVGKRTGSQVLPPSPPASRLRPQDCESGIGSRTSTLRSIASVSAAALSPLPPSSESQICKEGRRGGNSSSSNLSGVEVGVGCASLRCPSCRMPFDKAKKRRLIDACGHERCYSCMFANEACPLCAASRMSMALSGSLVGRPSPLGGTSDVIILPAKKASASICGGNPSICGSESTLYRGCSDGNCSGSGSRETGGQRPKLKTNGHFTSYMKSRKQHQQQHPDEASDRGSAAAHSWKPPRGNAATSYASHRQQQSGSSSARSSTTSSILSTTTASTAICRNPGGETQMRMTQSCPTPPHTRRKFFLSTKALRNPWRHHQETTGAVDPGGGAPGNSPPEIKGGSTPISALMTASAIAESVTSSLATSLTSSWSSTGTWAEGALRRIKALWWGGPPTAHDGRPRCRGTSAAAVGLNLLGQKDAGSSEEGEVGMNNAMAPLMHGVGPCRSRVNNTRSSQGDLRMRLGLLLGEEGKSWSSSHQGCNQSAALDDSVEKHNMEENTQSPETDSSRGCRSSLSPSSIGMHHHRNVSSGCSSLLLSSPSLASLEPSRPPHGGADGGAANTLSRGGCLIGNSANTSPASTLTGSSEADVHCRGNSGGLRGLGSSRMAGVVLGRGGGLAATRDRSSDSLASLASLCSSSTSPPANVTGQHQQTRRRHSVTTLQPGQVEDLDVFGMRRASIRRSARAAIVEGPLDPKIRFAKYLRRHGQQQQEILEQSQQYHRQLTLRPLFFEVPLPEWDAPRPLFIGRAWLLELIASSLGLPLLSTSSRQPFQTISLSEEITSTGTARRSKRQQTSPCRGPSSTQIPPQHSERGVVIVGGPGTGKTALLLQLVESSCFGRHRELPCRDTHVCSISGQHGAEDKCHLNLVSEKVCALASRVVAYHFCQAENNSTCLVPDFVHSVAAQLCQAPQLAAYRDLLLSNPNLQDLLSLPRCIANPDEAMAKGILEPLQSIGVLRLDGDSLTGSGFHQSLGNSFSGEAETMQSSLQGSFHSSMQGSGHGSQIGEVLRKDPMGASTDEDNVDSSFTCIILVDALCEAEYHRPDRGPSLCAFLAAHSQHFPPWLKLVVTARTRLADTVLAKDLPYKRISLDDVSSDENLQRDLVEYIHFRASHSPTIRANLSLATPSSSMLPQQPSTTSSTMAPPPHGEGAAVTRFAHHLLRLSNGSFLFTKLTLDLIERGHLVTKSSSYKVLPLTLAEIFLLHFNLRFHTVRAFERVLPILSVVLASLCPPTLLEVFYAINALRVERFLSWDEFISRFKTLSGFVVKRLDDTYMFFHPAFREWLLRREEGDSNKFLCDPRIGHLGIALRLTRLQSPLEGEALLELGHHILKAHPHRGLTLRWPLCSRDLQATWVAGVAADASQSLASLRNAHAPNVKVSRLLLLAGASPNIRAECPPGEGEPLLCLAAQRSDTQFASLLLEFGADAGAESTQGCIPLSIAASFGHQGVVAALLGARGPGAGAGRVDPRGRCPLVLAAAGGHASIVAMLLSSDWVLGTAGEEIGLEEASVQALVAAATKGHTELVEYLLDMCSVSLDAIDTLTGETALTAAVSHGRHSTVAALLMRGASIKATNSKGHPPLVAAAVGRGEGGEWLANKRLRPATLCSVMELLIQVGGASPEQRDSSGRTALAHAAATGDVTLVRLLLEKGAGIHLEDREGLSALGWACLSGHQATAKVLLDAGAQVQRADASGRTPLHLAAAAPPPRNPTSTPLVQHLLERGAVLEGVDAMGLRPLDRAVGTRNIPAVHCFLRRGARLGPATWAMAAGKPDVTLILLNKLLEDGNVLYKKGRLQEASHRYRYALKKCPVEEEAVSCIQEGIMWPSSEEEVEGVRDESSPAKLRELFDSVRVHLMLNLSRCMRKLGEYSEAVELAEGVLRLRPESYEAHYARAKAKVDLGDVDGALSDIEEALRIVPSTNREARRILKRVRDELQAEACPKPFDSREPCLGEDERASEE